MLLTLYSFGIMAGNILNTQEIFSQYLKLRYGNVMFSCVGDKMLNLNFEFKLFVVYIIYPIFNTFNVIF